MKSDHAKHGSNASVLIDLLTFYSIIFESSPKFCPICRNSPPTSFLELVSTCTDSCVSAFEEIITPSNRAFDDVLAVVDLVRFLRDRVGADAGIASSSWSLLEGRALRFLVSGGARDFGCSLAAASCQ